MALTFSGMRCRSKRPERISKQAFEGVQKMTTIRARATAWGKPTVGDQSHHVTQKAAPVPDAIMRRSNERRPRTEARSVILARTSEQSAEKNYVSHLRALITEAYPNRTALRANTQNQSTTAPPPGVTLSMADPPKDCEMRPALI